MNEKGWRRDKALELSSQGYSEWEIGSKLQISHITVHRDLMYLRKQAQENLKNHIQNTMPHEYHKCMIGINQVLQKAWEIVNKTLDERVRLQALALIRECNASRLEMITNGTVVSDALKYVNGKAEKLAAVECSQNEYSDIEEDEEEKEGRDKRLIS